MADHSPLEPGSSSAEADVSATVTNISGGVNLGAQRDVNIGGDVVRRDKVTTKIGTDGGAYVAGDVNVASGGEFAGRDKIVYEAPEPIDISLHQLPTPPRDLTRCETELAALFTQAGYKAATLKSSPRKGERALRLAYTWYVGALDHDEAGSHELSPKYDLVE